MKNKIYILALFLLLSCSSDNDEPEPEPIPQQCIRIGAICNDGTTSTATGSGACSHHGGVKNWICK